MCQYSVNQEQRPNLWIIDIEYEEEIQRKDTEICLYVSFSPIYYFLITVFPPLFLPPFSLPLLSSRSISTPLSFRKWQASPRSQPNMAQKAEVRAGISLILRLDEATQQEEKCLKSRQESQRQSCSHCQVFTRTPHYTIMTYRQTIQVRHRQVLWLLLLST